MLQRLRIPFFTFNRWISAVAAAAMMLCGGMVYVYATIALPLKQQMNYEQYQINVVGTMSSAGNLMGILPALFHDVFGPRPTAILASILMCSGYSLIYMSANHWFPTTYWLVGCFYLVFSAGESANFTAAMSTTIKNFNPKHRGKVSGILSCIYGLASAIYSGIFKFIFHYDLLGFLLFLSIVCAVVPLISGIFLNIVPKDFSAKKIIDETTSINVDSEKEVIAPVDESTSPWQMIQTVDFYLFCLIIFAGMGTGQAISNNLGTAVVSLGGSKEIVADLLIINSVASCTGRIVMGFLSDRLSPYAIRPTFLNVCVLSLGIVAFGFAFATVDMTYILVFGNGFSYGGINAVIIAYLADRFGPKYLGMNNTICKVSSLIGNYLMATVLASAVYSANIRGSGKTCHGPYCYLATFLIISGVCLVTFLANLYLMHRNQDMYRELRKKALIGKRVL